jgi:hypothetical protein
LKAPAPHHSHIPSTQPPPPSPPPNPQIAHYTHLLLRHVSVPVGPDGETFSDGIPKAATLGPYKAAEVRRLVPDCNYDAS